MRAPAGGAGCNFGMLGQILEKKEKFCLPKGENGGINCRPHHQGAHSTFKQQVKNMSKHSTLKATGTVGGKRSVLKRFERVKLMKERGQWKEGQSPIGLPKTKFES